MAKQTIDPQAAVINRSRIDAALAQAKQALRNNDGAMAERHLVSALTIAPRDAQILRLLGSAQSMQKRYADAVITLRDALHIRADDPLTHNSLGNALGLLGDKSAAAVAFARACALAPDLAPVWFNFGKALSEDARHAEALPVLERALQLAPDNLRARFIYAHALCIVGRGDESIAQYRHILAADSANAEAWLGLSNLKNVRFNAADVAAMERALTKITQIDDRASIRFALARGYEDIDHLAEAFRLYVDGNAHVRRHHAWDAERFGRRVDEFLAAFTPPPANAPNGQGEEAIFIVSMPRSGSSLTEQILASHAQVDGAGELDIVPQLLHEESQRRGSIFPTWVNTATPADWQRLGAAYLERTARWRGERPRFTDKLPDNWRHIGAILSMLPAARVVVCQRDPVETALACFRQLFVNGGIAFSYDLDDIAAYSRDFRRAVAQWMTLYPGRIRLQNYEVLLESFDGEVRALLDFCRLPFDPACLRFHETERAVRTASASQVREPLRRDTARAAKYGVLLDPLRSALGMRPFDAMS